MTAEERIVEAARRLVEAYADLCEALGLPEAPQYPYEPIGALR